MYSILFPKALRETVAELESQVFRQEERIAQLKRFLKAKKDGKLVDEFGVIRAPGDDCEAISLQLQVKPNGYYIVSRLSKLKINCSYPFLCAGRLGIR